MRILILSHSEVADYIGASLMDYGHEITWAVGGAVWEGLADQFAATNDGCLLLSNEEDQWKLARLLHIRGMPIWHDWKDIPPTREWPQGGKLTAGKGQG